MKQKLLSRRILQANGFTMVEVLIALMMSSIIMVAVYTSSKTQQDTYITQDQVVAMQQNLRATTLLMAREIRMAGYDPTGAANATITTALPYRFGFSQDIDEDGAIAGSESVLFGFSAANDADTLGPPAVAGTPDGIADAGSAPLGRNVGAGYQPIAENIHAIEFYYTLADGTQTTNATATGDEENISAVQVTVLAQTAIADPKFNAAPSFTTPSGAVWTLPVGYRGRMETMTIKCRNMGL